MKKIQRAGSCPWDLTLLGDVGIFLLATKDVVTD